jgi:hypothetical protein
VNIITPWPLADEDVGDVGDVPPLAVDEVGLNVPLVVLLPHPCNEKRNNGNNKKKMLLT